METGARGNTPSTSGMPGNIDAAVNKASIEIPVPQIAVELSSSRHVHTEAVLWQWHQFQPGGE